MSSFNNISRIHFFACFQMGYSTSSPQFSDKRKFPLYFRTSASDNLENPARIAVLKKFGWTRVALLVENYDIFVLVSRIGSTVHSTWLKNDTRCKAGGEKKKEIPGLVLSIYHTHILRVSFVSFINVV